MSEKDKYLKKYNGHYYMSDDLDGAPIKIGSRIIKKNKEIWKPIENCDGYEISNLGRIRSFWVMGSRKKEVEAKILKLNYNMSALIKNSKGAMIRFSVKPNLPKYFPNN